MRPDGGGDEGDPLLALLASASSEPVFPQMAVNTVTYANYRAIEQASGVPSPANQDEYQALTDAERAAWQASLLRIHGGPSNWPNLTASKIESMPELVGFDFFEVDQALRYGADPFIATLFHSTDGAYTSTATGQALQARGYERRVVATGLAWGQGGDGMTNINNIQNGDPFGGDVGLASRVAVLDPYTAANAFIWGILQRTAATHAGEFPSYADLPEYPALVTALRAGEGALLQTFILNRRAGEALATPPDDAPLPPYVLAAAADMQHDGQQVHRLVLLYTDETTAEQAAAHLPALVTAFDSGWLQTIGFDSQPPTVEPVSGTDYVAVTYDLTAPLPEEDNADAFAPSLVYGFWANAIRQGDFFPLGLAAPE